MTYTWNDLVQDLNEISKEIKQNTCRHKWITAFRFKNYFRLGTYKRCKKCGSTKYV